MEILNNIWLAFTTPNEGLVNLFLTFGALIEHFLFMKIFICILEISSTKKQQLTYVLLMSLISNSIMYIIPNPFNILLNYLMMIILAYIIFKLQHI